MWESLKLLGGVTDDGETFFLPCGDNFTGDITVRLLDALQSEFDEKLCVVLDNAPYFAANKVQDFAEDMPLELCYLPRGSPELYPAEECWHQLNQHLGNRLFDELDVLRDAVLTALILLNRQMSLRTYIRKYSYRWRQDGSSDGTNSIISGSLSTEMFDYHPPFPFILRDDGS